MRFSPGARPHHLRPALALVAVLVRALTVLLALQFCGAIHDVSDAVASFVSVADVQHEECPPDGPCDDCPPGCPNCHCAALGTLIPALRVDVAPALLEESLPACLDQTQAVTGPDRPALFRPPRARAVGAPGRA
jgi:hypothetical protein